ncbi:hypothetical protein [Piscinibacter sp. XHJ-5]|uniref:hypothetical protein n=1 Tax=Piscinibacter sp. XHJ-5 TaxID=3037797 RepID=UPI0024528D11|nr:hypothetical protein [Piscinibacter sp. XHJ-5]
MKMNDLAVDWPRQYAATVPMPLPANAPQAATAASDSTFAALLGAYRAAGGIARKDEVLRRIAAARPHETRRSSDMPDRDGSVSFFWNGIQWWPLFQFDGDMRVRPEVARIARELAGVIADWELALWFVTPNDWLGDALPIACVSRQRDATWRAARADRFIAVG